MIGNHLFWTPIIGYVLYRVIKKFYRAPPEDQRSPWERLQEECYGPRSKKESTPEIKPVNKERAKRSYNRPRKTGARV